MSASTIDKSELYNKSGSLWDQYAKTPSKSDSMGLANLLYDMLYKQHLKFPVGNSGKFEVAGPKGPNLSKIGKPNSNTNYLGNEEYNDDVPGYSMKYTLDF